MTRQEYYNQLRTTMKGNTFWKGTESTQFKKGHIPPNKGINLITVKCIKCGKDFQKSKYAKKLYCEYRCYWDDLKNRLVGKNNHFYKKHHKLKTINKISKSRKGKGLWRGQDKDRNILRKENHPNWLGGKSFEPYSPVFDRRLKESIRSRDNNKCQICKSKKFDYRLSVHHIDYNKMNNKENNLIALCRNCHTRTGFNRGQWLIYFKKGQSY